ncbi:Serpin 28Dc [Carabus blaptoides fortunei]
MQQSQKDSGNSYNNFMDDVIAQGVTNLCLAIDRTIASSNVNTASDYLVYSPINIASALALVLLGSNGKTFDELSNLLGLAYGLNIANYSIPVHERYGEILAKIENSSPHDTQLIKFANAIFVQNDFSVRDQYRSTSMAVYGSEVRNLDFRGNPLEARNTINNWVAEKTLGKIQNLIERDPPTITKAVIVSSLYFKSNWENPFDSHTTKLHPFYPNGKDQPTNIKVNLMANGAEYPYFNDTNLNCQIIGLPYKGKTVTFYLVIPHNSNPQKLRDLENRLTAIEIKRIVGSTRKTPAIVALPKMTLTSTIQLKNVLENLGVRSLFDPREADLSLISPGYNPNAVKNTFEPIYNYNTRPVDSTYQDEPFVFSRIGKENDMTDKVNLTKSMRKKRQNAQAAIGVAKYDTLDQVRHMLNSNGQHSNPGLYADQVVHKVFVDVNEKGTEAAAATAVGLTRDGSRIVVKADVPFFFFIHHEQTKTVLFWGSVNTPSPSFAD